MENFLDNISSILNVFYSSIKTEGYKFIDNISTITTDIFQKEPLKSIYINKNMNSFSLIISTIVSGIILYYVFKTEPSPTPSPRGLWGGGAAGPPAFLLDFIET